MEQQIKLGTLLRLKEPWRNHGLDFSVDVGEIILVISNRKSKTVFHFYAVIPDGRVKGFCGSHGTFDGYFEVVYHGTTTAETRDAA